MTIHVKVLRLGRTHTYTISKKGLFLQSFTVPKRKRSKLSVGELNPGLPRAIIVMTGGNTNHYTNRD
jgi:hypothetical protein